MEAKFFTEIDPNDEAQEEREKCYYAARFLEWAETLCSENGWSVVAVNQAKVLLIDKYFEWRNSVPKTHRDRTGERGHFCIFHVFEHAYRKLRLKELSMTPPMLFVPEVKAEPRMRPIPALFLGEVVDEEVEP